MFSLEYYPDDLFSNKQSYNKQYFYKNSLNLVF